MLDPFCVRSYFISRPESPKGERNKPERAHSSMAVED